MVFNGSGAAEIFEAQRTARARASPATSARSSWTSDDLEVIDVNALGNTDTAIVNDLSGTDVAKIDVDQAGTLGGATGDGQADTVIVNGTNGADIIDVFGAGTSVSVVGLAAQVASPTPRGRTTPSPSTPWAATTASRHHAARRRDQVDDRRRRGRRSTARLAGRRLDPRRR